MYTQDNRIILNSVTIFHRSWKCTNVDTKKKKKNQKNW